MTLFVTFEGTEGAGKTTQINLLAGVLRRSRVDVTITREPGGTELGESLRTILLDSSIPVAAETEAYLMTAARSEHVRQVIEPALGRGEVVLCDRFYDSTYAYQGAGRGLAIADLIALQRLAIGNVTPDVTVLLDLPAEVGLLRRRGAGNGNRIDRESLTFHERVAACFREFAAQDSVRWHVVDATLPPDLVHTAILKHVVARLGAASLAGQGSAST